jgi:hypothetical protein
MSDFKEDLNAKDAEVFAKEDQRDAFLCFLLKCLSVLCV